MANTIKADGFVLGGYDINTMGYTIGEIDGSSGVARCKVSSDIALNQVKTSNSDTWKILSQDYSEGIQFSFDIFKKESNQSGFTYEISETELRNLDRFLKSKHYGLRKFKFKNTDDYAIYYYVVCTSCEAVYVGGVCYGVSVNFVSDRPYGITDDNTFVLEMESSSETWTIEDGDDEVGNEIIPSMEITILENCDFSIHNNLTDTTFGIDGCVVNEVINLNGNTLEMTSSVRTNSELLDDFNDSFLVLTNTYTTRNNVLTVSGMANIELMAKFNKKVGV